MKKLLVLLFLLSGCGFERLYAQKNVDESVAGEMRQVKVEAIADRFGQQLRNDLIDIMTPEGTPSSPRYKLYAELAEKKSEGQALRRDITATRERVKYKVVYYMTENGKELFRGDSIAYVSYDIMSNPYSTTVAAKKTETDAASIIANDISLRVAAYFHTKQGKK